MIKDGMQQTLAVFLQFGLLDDEKKSYAIIFFMIPLAFIEIVWLCEIVKKAVKFENYYSASERRGELFIEQGDE